MSRCRFSCLLRFLLHLGLSVCPSVLHAANDFLKIPPIVKTMSGGPKKQCKAVFQNETLELKRSNFTYYRFVPGPSFFRMGKGHYQKSTYYNEGTTIFSEKDHGTFGKIYAETKNVLDFVYGIYSARNTVSREWISKMKEEDKFLLPECSSYIVFSDSKTSQPQVAIRIYNTFFARSGSASRIPIEIEFPHLIMPDRVQGNKVLIELGRLAKADELVVGNLGAILRISAMSLNTQGLLGQDLSKAVIYIEASAVGAKLYKRFGFEPIFSPKEVGVDDTYILRMNAALFVNKFMNVKEFYYSK